ncbi:hypothetical protein LTR66_008032 [Elasticomyces elasticus]|nr:hypothetical protein LTR66_008032 [Elasticomyces elasticus]
MVMAKSVLKLAALALAAQTALAQLLNNTYIPFPSLAVSSGCSTALNASVTCPWFLSRIAYSNGNFCDPQILAWRKGGGLNSTAACSNCWLKSQRNQLNSPLGYDANVAVSYAALTSSCNATAQYSVTSQSVYAYNATATTPATTTTSAAPLCTGSYTVQPTDTCNSVAQALNVSTYNLLQYNGIDLFCRNFNATVGLSLCQPPQCPTKTWQPEDTCNTVVGSLANVTIAQFLAWNPNFNNLCRNALNFIGYQVCIGYVWRAKYRELLLTPLHSNPGGSLSSSPATTTAAPGNTAAASAQPAPSNSVNGTTSRCAGWYTVQNDDNCAKVSVAAGISLSDFYFLNPEINANCTNLWLGNAYCVRPVGDIKTYPGYTQSSTSALITVTPNTFTPANTGVPASTSSPGYVATVSLLPTASGTIPGCDTYRNYDNSTNANNACADVAHEFLVSFSSLQQWNPSLTGNKTTCKLASGYSYCAVQSNSTAVLPQDYCIAVNATMSGTTASCSCFTVVMGYNAGDYVCADVASDSHITVNQLTTWNTWLSSNCDTALYANLNSSDTRAVCVGVNGTTTSATATSVVSTTATTQSQGPTQSGEVPGCQKHYTVLSGDSCSSIDTQFNITFQQFYNWNPSLGNNCQYLVAGNSYCVLGPATSTTTSSTVTSATQGPTQSGEVSGCLQHYTVKSGDSCSAIDSQFGITFQQLYSWNPSVGANCQYLGIGNSYCVKGPASTASSTATSTASGPTQSGEVKNCLQHYTVKSGDSCSAIDSQFGITFQQFYSWNPSVGNNCQYLGIGNSYCVKA